MSARRLMVLFTIVLAVSTCCIAQKPEIALTAGGTFTSDANARFVLICPVGVVPCPTVNGSVQSGHRIFVEVTPAAQIFSAKVAALYLELPVAAIPSQTLHLSSTPGVSIGHLSSIFVTPALRLKLLPKGPLSPFVSLGGGWAYYALDNGNNNRAALEYGGGVDVKTATRHLRFRAELRDFVTANPNFANTEGAPFGLITSGLNGLHRHNILLGGGLVVSF